MFVVFNSRRSNESKIAIIGCKVFVAVLKLSFQNILCLWCGGDTIYSYVRIPKPDTFSQSVMLVSSSASSTFFGVSKKYWPSCPFTRDNRTNKEIIGFPFTYFDKHNRVNNSRSKYFVDPLVQNKHAAFSRFFIIFCSNPFLFMMHS